MSTRMQQRRGSAAQWTSANPVLAAGEIGFVTDTGKFKMGNGTSTWSQLEYFSNAAELTAAINSVVGMAPETLNTLSEISDALGDDPNFLSALVTKTQFDSAVLSSASSLQTAINSVTSSLTASLTDHASTTTSVHGIADTSALATKTYADGKASTAQTAAIAAAATDATTKAATAKSEAIAAAATDATTKANAAQTAAIAAVTKSSLGLGAVNNTEDAGKPVSTAQAAAIATAKSEAISSAASAADTKVSTHNSSTTNVHGISDTSALATKTYADAIGTTATNAIALKAPIASPTFTGTVSGITSSMVGLGNVNNTADSAKPVSTAQQTALDAKLNLAGGTMTGALTLSGAPTSDLHATTKVYVDNLAAGIQFHKSVRIATATNWSAVYANGTNGYGATLTASVNQSINPADGVTLVVGDRILVKSQTDAKQNGIYDITSVGGSSSKWVLTRSADSDNNPNGEVAGGDFTFVTEGSTNVGIGFILSSPSGVATIGTDNLVYAQFNAAQAVSAGTNITKTGATIAVADAPTFSGAVTASAGVTFSDGTQTKVGVPSITTIATAISSSATLAAGEADKFVPLTGAVQITLPATGYSTGQSIDFYQASGTGASFASTNGVVGTPGLKLRTTYSVATAMKISGGWLLFGDLSA
jgi:hypothetical protein